MWLYILVIDSTKNVYLKSQNQLIGGQLGNKETVTQAIRRFLSDQAGVKTKRKNISFIGGGPDKGVLIYLVKKWYGKIDSNLVKMNENLLRYHLDYGCGDHFEIGIRSYFEFCNKDFPLKKIINVFK